MSWCAPRSAAGVSVASLVSEVAAAHLRLDALVNNAGHSVPSDLPELDDEDWKRTLDVDLHGIRWCAEAAAELMDQEPAAIVNLSALPIRSVLDRYAAVAASKAAQQEALTRYLAVELGARRIRVNTVSTGLVDNYVFGYWPDVEGRRRQARAGPALGRLSLDEDVAEAVVYLASGAARAITGSTLVLDAGMSLRLAGPPPGRTTAIEPASRAEAGPGVSPDAVAVLGMGLAVPGANRPEEFWRVLRQDASTLGEPEHFDLERRFDPNPKAEDKTHVRAVGFLRGFIPHPTLAAELAEGRWASNDLTAHLMRHCLFQALGPVTRREGDWLGCYAGALPGSVSLEESMLRATAVSTADTPPAKDRLREALTPRYPHVAALPRAPSLTTWSSAPARGCCLRTVSGSSSTPPARPRSTPSASASRACCRANVTWCCVAAATPAAEATSSCSPSSKGCPRTGRSAPSTRTRPGYWSPTWPASSRSSGSTGRWPTSMRSWACLAGSAAASTARAVRELPDVTGQKLSVRRARAVNDLDADQVDWIVDHGTGTRIGDAVELEGLAEVDGPRGHVVTSNKPMGRHGGWAADVVSVVHALLGLQHHSIPSERHFGQLPRGVRADGITVSVTNQPWAPGPGHRRTAAVRAYVLGGTNGHLVLHGPEPADASAPRGALTPRADDPVVLVSWQTHLPAAMDRDATAAWLRGSGAAPRRTFGQECPLPPFKKLRMPSLTARSMDHTQLMATAVTAAFVAEHGELREQHRETTGVITGHVGPTRAMSEYSVRVGEDNLLTTVAEHPAVLPQDCDRLRAYVLLLRNRLPHANDDSMPGQLANVISCQVANRLRLNGPSLAVDSGRSSTQAALHVAGRYLATGELNVALVLGINGNSSAAMAELADARPEALAEGVVLLVLTRRSLAERPGWPILAGIHTRAAADDAAAPQITSAESASDHLGAEGAHGVLRALHLGVSEVTVCNQDDGLRVTAPGPGNQQAPPDAALNRSVLAFRRRDPVGEKDAAPALRPGALILTDSAATAQALGSRARERRRGSCARTTRKPGTLR
ncbi:Enoyl-[acyl-carrier-protein] reductase [NADPH] FabL (plasmid) [Streptomyces sp. YIM 121038]|nr:Enoyl-[acyl-carrier-protein] reductase [NADPH] FabL [Streptomyces sp. YIM 121038]